MAISFFFFLSSIFFFFISIILFFPFSIFLFITLFVVFFIIFNYNLPNKPPKVLTPKKLKAKIHHEKKIVKRIHTEIAKNEAKLEVIGKKIQKLLKRKPTRRIRKIVNELKHKAEKIENKLQFNKKKANEIKEKIQKKKKKKIKKKKIPKPKIPTVLPPKKNEKNPRKIKAKINELKYFKKKIERVIKMAEKKIKYLNHKIIEISRKMKAGNKKN